MSTLVGVGYNPGLPLMGMYSKKIKLGSINHPQPCSLISDLHVWTLPVSLQLELTSLVMVPGPP